MSAEDWKTVRAQLAFLAPANRELALAALERLEAEAQRVAGLPELEWAQVCAAIAQRFAALARAEHQPDAKALMDVLDRGKTYVGRLRARVEAAEAEVKAQRAETQRDLQAMRERIDRETLACKKAEAERDEARAMSEQRQSEARGNLRRVVELERERDALRAEVERLRELTAGRKKWVDDLLAQARREERERVAKWADRMAEDSHNVSTYALVAAAIRALGDA